MPRVRQWQLHVFPQWNCSIKGEKGMYFKREIRITRKLRNRQCENVQTEVEQYRHKEPSKFPDCSVDRRIAEKPRKQHFFY